MSLILSVLLFYVWQGRLIFQSLRAHVSWPQRDVCTLFKFVEDKGNDGINEKEFCEYVESSDFLGNLKKLKDRMEEEEKEQERMQEEMMKRLYYQEEERVKEFDEDGQEIVVHTPTKPDEAMITNLKSALKNTERSEDEKAEKRKRRVKFILPGDHDVYGDHGPNKVKRKDAELLSNYADAIQGATALVDGHVQELETTDVEVAPGELLDIEQELEQARLEASSSASEHPFSPGENPVPVKSRSVLMFTHDFFSRKGSLDGLRGVDSRSDKHKQASDEETILPPIQVSTYFSHQVLYMNIKDVNFDVSKFI